MILNTQSPAFKALERYNTASITNKPLWTVNIGVLDTFDHKYNDINGDLCPDVSHGDFIKSVLEDNLAFCPKKIISFNIKTKKDGTASDRNLLKVLNTIQQNHNIDYLNYSLSEDIDFDDDILVENKITQKNIKKKRNLLISSDLLTNLELKIHQVLENIAQRTKVFICAGNAGSSCFNIDNLVKGVERVGYLDLTYKQKNKKGEPTTEHPDSAKNTLITMNAKSNAEVYPVLANKTVIGFSLSKEKATKKIVDFPVPKVTGHKIIGKFVGKNIGEITAVEEDYTLLKKYKSGDKDKNVCENLLSKKLLSIKNLRKEKLLDAEENKFLKVFMPKGDYIDVNSYLNLMKNSKNVFKLKKAAAAPTLVFNTTKDGTIIYNPFKRGTAAKVINGSSISSPVALAQVANKDFISKTMIYRSNKINDK